MPGTTGGQVAFQFLLPKMSCSISNVSCCLTYNRLTTKCLEEPPKIELAKWNRLRTKWPVANEKRNVTKKTTTTQKKTHYLSIRKIWYMNGAKKKHPSFHSYRKPIHIQRAMFLWKANFVEIFLVFFSPSKIEKESHETLNWTHATMTPFLHKYTGKKPKILGAPVYMIWRTCCCSCLMPK